jgi:hypothetical protein
MLGLRISGAVAVLVPLATSALAQSVITTPDLGMGTEGYVQVPPPIPQGGCVWNNAVFSDGAILEKQQQPRAFFRCVQGTWQSFDSYDAARSGSEPAPPIAQRLGPRSR